MPQMSGVQLAQRLGAVRPEMRILCMSGYTDDATGSGKQVRPARVLVVASAGALERVYRALRAEGYLVEAASDAVGALPRIERAPPVEILVVNGVSAIERHAVLSAATMRGVWCVHLRSEVAAELPPDQRAELIAALPPGADDSSIAGTIRTLVAAGRAKRMGA